MFAKSCFGAGYLVFSRTSITSVEMGGALDSDSVVYSICPFNLAPVNVVI